MAPDISDYMTTKEAAKVLGFHIKSIQTMIRNKNLAAIKVGHIWLIAKESVAKYKSQTKGLSKNDPRRRINQQTEKEKK